MTRLAPLPPARPARPARRTLLSAVAAASLLAPALAACGGDGDHSYDFGPYRVAAGDEIVSECVQISLHNDAPVYVNTVELTTGPGFHHSNWTYIPDYFIPGPDGKFDCDERGYSELIAAVHGGVLFAQSTQVQHEVQAFPPGVAVKLPAHTKLIGQVHLLNPTDAQIEIRPNISLTPIPEAEVVTRLAGITFQDQALALPANRQSRFTVECELAERHRALTGVDPDFNIYYALAHYHELGTGLTLEAIRPDGTATTVYDTATHVGDTLGGPIAPLFNMAGFTRLRFSCNFYNPRAEVVKWGFGDQEMCVFLAFSDSPYTWAGGANEPDAPENETPVGNALHYTSPCSVYATDSRH
jgi:hypothetical protein